MLNFKKAFTLAEVMICLIIIGVVSTLTLVTAKPFDKYNAYLYQKAYSALNLAAYNVKIGLPNGQTFAGNVLDTASHLCQNLTYWINTTDAYCTSLPVPIIIPTTAVDADMHDKSIQFISTNGMYFYFTDVRTASGTDSLGNPYSVSGRVIFVDLNGDKMPNTAVWRSGSMVDRVAFVITSSGDVIPIGYPEIDTRYITAKYLYADGKTFSKPMSYYEAKNRAWGNTTYSAEIQSLISAAALSTLFPSTLLSVVYPAAPGADTANGCHDNNTPSGVASPCKVVIEDYYSKDQ